jgi:methyl coenzyme M reductase subunit D
LLKKQLILKNIISSEEWDSIKDGIYYDFRADTYFTEIKNQEIMRERLALVAEYDQYVGKYFSRQQVMKDVLKYTDEDIEALTTQIEVEIKSGEIEIEDEDM